MNWVLRGEVRARRGFVPAADLLSCSCKKVGKEHGPDSGARPAAGFPALREMLGRPKTHFVRFALSVQTVGPSQSGGRACRTPPSISVLLGTCIGAAANSRIPNSPDFNQGAVSRPLAAGCSAVGCSPFGAAEQHSGLGRARSAHPLLAQGGRSNGESAANAVRSALQPQDASSAGNPRPQAGDSGAGACSFLSCTSKKGSRRPGRNPGGLSRTASAFMECNQAARPHGSTGSSRLPDQEGNTARGGAEMCLKLRTFAFISMESNQMHVQHQQRAHRRHFQDEEHRSLRVNGRESPYPKKYAWPHNKGLTCYARPHIHAPSATA